MTELTNETEQTLKAYLSMTGAKCGKSKVIKPGETITFKQDVDIIVIRIDNSN